MSRQQWGHGYYKGKQDAETRKNKPKYIIQVNDGYPSHLYIIREQNEDIYVCEEFDEAIRNIWMLGMIIPFNASEDDADISHFCEFNINEIGDYKAFISQEAALAYADKLLANYAKRMATEGEMEEIRDHWARMLGWEG